jgi:probable O-glycosylation ligase (exosortase A-associated)
MRDLLVTLMVFGSLPLILRKPFFGVLVWTWLGLMNPHRVCWGFARNMPYAQIVVLVLFASLVISYQKTARRTEVHALTVMLGIWWAWMLVTTVLAFFPYGAWIQWNKVWKIMLLTFIIIYLLNTRQRIHALVWTMALSLGFYGVKGGIFTLTTGGSFAVYGPAGTFIGGNNEIGLALIMTVPLIRYLQLQAKAAWLRIGLVGAMLLTMI